MSRRYTDRNLTELDTDAELAWEFFESGGIPWWYATRMPEPWEDYFWHQWQSAWADYTMHVAENVWRNVGGKIYAVHRDAMLRDDLKSWLLVKAVEAGAYFTPKPEHPAPERNYAAWLYGRLKVVARDHFTEVVASSQTGPGQEAREAYRSEGPSLERQAELKEESGLQFIHHALWGRQFETDDPADVLVRLENLAEQIEQIERDADLWSTSSSAADKLCLHVGCLRPSHTRGLCTMHYAAERRRTSANCSVEGCTKPINARGLCPGHYNQHRAQAIADGTWDEYVRPKPECSEDGCTADARAGGRCQRHYDAHRRATAPPCSVEGCTRPVHTRGRGLCKAHDDQWRRARDAGEGEVYPT